MVFTITFDFETVQIYCTTTGTGDGKTTDGLIRNIKDTKATQNQNGSYMDVMTGGKVPPKSSPGAEKNSDQQLSDQSFEAEIASVVQELEGKDNPPQQTTAQKIFNRMPNIMPSRKEKPKKVETPAAEPTFSEVIVRPTITRRLHHRTRTPTAQHEQRTRELAVSLILATGAMSKSSRLEALCEQLAEYPRTRGIALEENVVPVMLSMRNSSNIYTHRQANLGLSLVGYVNPVKGRGINILSLDGGGTRGFYTLELLKQLENYTGKRVIDNFDLICGVSAGALIATLLCSSNLSIRECETRFREFSKKMFTQGRVPGISKLVLTHSYYDTKLWEEVLKANVDQASFLDTAKILSCPKFVTVSTIMNAEKMEHFLFRNYEYPVGRSSRYPGSMNYKMWEAVRASSAAPGYYEDYKLGEHIHVDGGVLSNNPTAIALHEANVLWPREDIQCIVSIGTGRFEPAATGYKDIQSIPLKDKLLKIVQSATNTEGVHTTLHDLMPPQSYFRFNPYMSEDFQLDEIREASWEKMYMDAKLYSDKNHHKLHACAKKLLLPKTAKQAVQEKCKFASDRYYSSVFGKPRISSSRYFSSQWRG